MARILVVDDVEVVRVVISKILRRAGHDVEQADGADMAMARVNVRVPDVVVTDLWMPGVTGLGLMRMLKARFPALVMLAMTGGAPQHDQETSLDQARQAGAFCVLLKPIDKDELVAAVAEALEAVEPKKGSMLLS
jgi:two-component system chemotaxis response regulator CheY